MGSEKACIVDSHIHLSHTLFDNSFPFLGYDRENIILEEQGTREYVIRKMKDNRIRFCVEPAIDLESNPRLLALADEYRGYVLPAVGIHPTRTWQYSEYGKNGERITKHLSWQSRKKISKYSEHELVVAIGETGLDYHLPRTEQHRTRQILWFIWQLLLAHKRRLPLILHIRQADRHALVILHLFKRYLHGGVCHCFNGTPEQARHYTMLGLKLGIGASLLLAEEKCRNLKQVVLETRLEDILLETDGPYVKPPCPGISAKHLKKARNTSLILPAVVQQIAEIKGVSCTEVEQITTKNVTDLFGVYER